MQRYHSSGSSSCAVCDPHRPLHYDGTPFGLVLRFHDAQIKGLGRAALPIGKAEAFRCFSRCLVNPIPATLSLHVSKCRASRVSGLVNRASLDSYNRDQHIHDTSHVKCTVEATALRTHDSCAVKITINATPLAIRVTMVDARTKPVRTEKL